MSKDRKRLIMLLSCIILVLSFALVYLNTDLFKETEVGTVIDNNIADNVRFYRDYPSVNMENIYYYASYEEIVEVLTKGSGIVFFGFPACPYCQVYAPVLDEVARDRSVEKIYYFNIKDIREKETDEYKRLVEILDKYLETDDKGNKRIYVPDSYFVKNGKIVGHNNSMSTLHSVNAKEYFTEDVRKQLKNQLIELIEKVYEPICDDTSVNVYGC